MSLPNIQPFATASFRVNIHDGSRPDDGNEGLRGTSTAIETKNTNIPIKNFRVKRNKLAWVTFMFLIF
jgi:hypothetical protein